MIKRILIVLLVSSVLANLNILHCQFSGKLYYNGENGSHVIQTPVPFLNINPDSRAGGMGDVGAATSPDMNSLNFNTAKYAFIDDDLGFSASYCPWLANISTDINLAYLTLVDRYDKQSVFAFGVRYFSLGNITFTNDQGTVYGSKNPNEFSLDGAFSRQFSDRISGGIAFRYIRSDLAAGSVAATGGTAATAGNAFAVDVSSYYHRPLTINNLPGELAFGINISNLGSKISYSEGSYKELLPANLRLGTSVTMELDSYNKLTISLDANKLLVPTPPEYASDSAGTPLQDPTTGEYIIYKGMNPNVSVPVGIIHSFYDAPNGFSEQMKEISIAGGLEYWYRNQFAIRGGYFNESAEFGNRKYMTLGIGLKMTVMTFDFSYLVPTAGSSSPLANTMRFTFSFNMGKPKKQKEAIQ